MRPHPTLFETNARLFLRDLSARYGRGMTLASVPDEEWERLATMGVDGVWLMGVWQRSRGAREVALRHAVLREEYGRALPGWTEEDVEGSPYAIHAYTLDPALGAPDELRVARDHLHHRGLGLVVDFVPNHLALDHPWTATHSERFVRASVEGAAANPDWFYTTKDGTRLAHGRDPYYGPWTDTVQVDFFSEDLRQALTGELLRIAETADGARCDMAMLGLNGVFEWLWGDYTPNRRPAEEFWAVAIQAVKARHPDFVFIAEAYWGHEEELQELGFDHTYDKGLYDRLQWNGAAEVRAHLMEQRSSSTMGRWARFIENHDEGRAAAVFGPERARAAATVIATLPGLRLIHDGQHAGKQVRVPVQLVRGPEEAADKEMEAFYERLLRCAGTEVFHTGAWELLECHEGGPGGGRHEDILAWRWRSEGEDAVVIVNYSGKDASGVVEVPEGPREWRDGLAGDGERGFAVVEGGLPVALGPWEARVLV